MTESDNINELQAYHYCNLEVYQMDMDAERRCVGILEFLDDILL
jgi:hypothetical protein